MKLNRSELREILHEEIRKTDGLRQQVGLGSAAIW